MDTNTQGTFNIRVGADLSQFARAVEKAEQDAKSSGGRIADGLAKPLDAALQKVPTHVRSMVEQLAGNLQKEGKTGGEAFAAGMRDGLAALHRPGLIDDSHLATLTDALKQAGGQAEEAVKGVGRQAKETRTALEDAGRKGAQGLEEITQQGHATEGVMGSLGRTVMKVVSAFVGLFAINRVRSFAQSCVQAFRAIEESESRLRAMVEANGGAVGRSAAQLAAYSKQLQRETLFQADTIELAMSQLLTYHSISGRTFERTLRLATDLSSVYGGLSQSTEALARALDDPIQGLAMLSKQGFKFEESTLAQIRALVQENKLLEAQRLILEDLESQVGGVAAKMKSGMVGALDDLSKAWLGFKEAIGQSLVQMGNGEGAVRRLTGLLKTMARHADDVTAAFWNLFKALMVGGVVVGFVQLRRAVLAAESALVLLRSTLTTINVLIGPRGWFALGVAGLAALFQKMGSAAREAARQAKEAAADFLDAISKMDEASLKGGLASKKATIAQIEQGIANDEERIRVRRERIKEMEAGAAKAYAEGEVLTIEQRIERLKTWKGKLEGEITQMEEELSSRGAAGGDPTATENLIAQVSELRKLRDMRALSAAEAKKLAAAEDELRAKIRSGTLSVQEEISALEALGVQTKKASDAHASLANRMREFNLRRQAGLGADDMPSDPTEQVQEILRLEREIADIEKERTTAGGAIAAQAAALVEARRQELTALKEVFAQGVKNREQIRAQLETITASIVEMAPKLAEPIADGMDRIRKAVEETQRTADRLKLATATGTAKQITAAAKDHADAQERVRQAVARVQREMQLAGVKGKRLNELSAELVALLNSAGVEAKKLESGTLPFVDGLARGVLSVADAMGILDDRTRRALQGVIDLVGALQKAGEARKLVDSAGKLTSAGTLGMVGAMAMGAGAVAGILGAVFARNKAEGEAQRHALEQHRATLEKNRDALEKLRTSLDALGNTFLQSEGGPLGKAQGALGQVFANLRDAEREITEEYQRRREAENEEYGGSIEKLREIDRQEQEALARLHKSTADAARRALADAGITQEELTRLAERYGITLNGSYESFVDFFEAIKDADIGSVLSSFTGQMGLLRTEFELLNITDPVAKLKKMREVLANFVTGDLQERLAGLDLTTAEGRAGLQALIQEVFAQVKGGTFDITQLNHLSIQQLLEAFGGFKELLDKELESGGDGKSQSYQVTRTITETTANRMVGVLTTIAYWAERTARLLAGGDATLPPPPRFGDSPPPAAPPTGPAWSPTDGAEVGHVLAAATPAVPDLARLMLEMQQAAREAVLIELPPEIRAALVGSGGQPPRPLITPDMLPRLPAPTPAAAAPAVVTGSGVTIETLNVEVTAASDPYQTGRAVGEGIRDSLRQIDQGLGARVVDKNRAAGRPTAPVR